MKCGSKILFSIASVYAVALVLACAVSVFAFGNSSWVYSESGALEMSQAAVILVSFACWLCAFLKNPSEKDSMITLFFTVLLWAFFMREVDFDKMGIAPALVFMLYGAGRKATIVIGIGASLLGAALHFKRYVNQSLEFLVSYRGRAAILAGVLLLAGEFFEYNWGGANSEFFEEGLELAAYVCLLFSSLATKDRVSFRKADADNVPAGRG